MSGLQQRGEVVGELVKFFRAQTRAGEGNVDDFDYGTRTAAHHGNSVGQKQGFVHRVSDHERGKFALLPDALKLNVHAAAGDGVERTEGFVQQQESGFKTQRTGDGGALAHASGKLAGAGLFEPLQTDQTDEMAQAVGIHREAGNFEGQREIG